ncbi:hypothetical protein SAMN05421595_1232 [Austwickia chelonae]|uniref:Uncharacterized protein n=1 Tax=Austwickia chelonae NBRC 105200 TaxID=1184607 RepID=K6ULN5_9MICO|nr:hypothetical protein [Austwickia chelonae]GAB77401.1 hypothetical protein AUCHE_05_03110 [Austwickia chelonae NBRC 105200]SEW09625.1 hypothetical protein SAMN05421595_1232 [Austwickia chelonae]
MTTRGLVDPSMASDTHTPFSTTAEADERMFQIVEQQSAWAAAAVARSDPQQWLFAERARYVREGSCDPWAEQMLYRAGLLPLAN